MDRDFVMVAFDSKKHLPEKTIKWGPSSKMEEQVNQLKNLRKAKAKVANSSKHVQFS